MHFFKAGIAIGGEKAEGRLGYIRHEVYRKTGERHEADMITIKKIMTVKSCDILKIEIDLSVFSWFQLESVLFILGRSMFRQDDRASIREQMLA